MLIGDFDNVPNMLLEMNANTKKYFKCLPIIIILSHLLYLYDSHSQKFVFDFHSDMPN